MQRELKTVLKSFGIELAVYGVLVLSYFFLVLHFMGDWLFHLYKSERKVYAAACLILIIVQGMVLEFLTRNLLRLIKSEGGE
jgi:Na+/H+-dicarboxylate symporter